MTVEPNSQSGLEWHFAQTLARLAGSGSAEAVTSLAQALKTGASDAVSELAAATLHALPAGPAQDALCRFAVDEGDEAMLAIAAEGGYVPSEPHLRTALLALGGRWGVHGASDPEESREREAYGAPPPDLHRRLAAAEVEGGHDAGVHDAVSGRERHDLAEMTRDEWRGMVGLMSRPDRIADAWRLALEAPPLWARELLLAIGDVAALPNRDREDLAGLRALAESCGEEHIPLSAGTSCVKTLTAHEGAVTSLAITPDGSLLATGSQDQTIRLWRLTDGVCVASLHGHEGAIDSLLVTPDGTLLVSGSSDASIRLWRLPHGECVGTLWGHESGVDSLVITPDGSLLASGSAGSNCVRIWSLPDGEWVSWLCEQEEAVTSLAVTPDGSRLVSGSEDGTICLWRLPDGDCVAKLDVASRSSEGSEDSEDLADSWDPDYCSDGELDPMDCGNYHWYDRSCEPCGYYRGRADDETDEMDEAEETSVTSLAVSPDGSLLVSAHFDDAIRLWRLSDRQHGTAVWEHDGWVNSLTFTPDGGLLAAGVWLNATIRLFRMPDGEEVAELEGHDDDVLSLAVTPDGLLLASGSEDGTIRLWNSELAALAATPVASLARVHERLLALRGDNSWAVQCRRAWIDFMLALVDRHRRFDIEVVAADRVEVGEFDVEIGD